jgi:hypothetical protein
MHCAVPVWQAADCLTLRCRFEAIREPLSQCVGGILSEMAWFRKLTFQSRIECLLCELRKCRLGSLSPAFCY